MRRSDAGFLALVTLSVIGGCTGEPAPVISTLATSTTTTATPSLDAPEISRARLESGEPRAHELVELSVELEADYDNPFDQRQVRLDAELTGPDGHGLAIPGFSDGEDQWKLRFTPTSAGRWDYQVTVTDRRGVSDGLEGTIEVAASDHPGFIRIRSDVDPSYSSRYFAYEDGNPWYGRGHATSI
jgi:hypothetical protein